MVVVVWALLRTAPTGISITPIVLADINPNDIESVTVLKGPEATALYGSQASSGAIVITTKKGKSTDGKLLITYDNNFRMQKNTRFAEVNNDFGPGTSNGVPTAPPLTANLLHSVRRGRPARSSTTIFHHFIVPVLHKLTTWDLSSERRMWDSDSPVNI